MARTITETQYMELRDYRDGYDHWKNGGASASLVARGLLVACWYDRGMVHITPEGREALSAFETRYGITV